MSRPTDPTPDRPTRSDERRRTILFVHSSDPSDHLGGGETTLIALTRALADTRSLHGFRPVVAVSGAGEFQRRLQTASVPVRVVAMDPLYYKLAQTSSRERLSRAARALPSVLGLARVIRTERAALVCTNVQAAHIYGALAARLTRRPVLMYMRDIPHGPFSSRFFPFWARHFADRVVAISTAVRDFYCSSAGHGQHLAERLTVIHNGIDLRAFTPCPPGASPSASPSALIAAELRLRDASPVITLIGRLQPLKGQHLLIAALPKIHAHLPAARVVLVGDSFAYNRDYREQLQAQARALGVRHAVHFTGQRTDIRELLSVTDIAVSASSHEAFGRTVVEAMAMARPVVATRSGGPDDVIVDGETGYLVPTGSPDALAGAIVRIWSDPASARAMGRRGQARARAHFDLRTMVDAAATEFTMALASTQRYN